MKHKETKTEYTMDMCNGSVFKKMVLFAFPLMCSGILQLLFNAADIVVVGKFAGDNALAAVGSNSSLIALLTNLFMGLSIGVNVLAANQFGAGRTQDIRKTVHTAMLVSVISGLFLTAVGIIGARQILIWMKTPPEVLDLAVTYLRIYFIGMTSTMIYNFGSAVLRAVGDTKRPFYFLLLAGVINVVLNLIFVIVFRMSVAGVAIATAVSQTVAAVLIVRCMMNDTGAVRLILTELKIDWQTFVRIMKIGLPAGIQGVVFALSNVVIQSSVNSFGKTVMAGSTAAANLESFVYFAMTAFYQATISFTSQNFGAGKFKRINRIVLVGIACVTVVGLAMGSLVTVFGSQLLTIYSSSADVIKFGQERLMVISTTYFLCGIMEIMVGALRGMGYSIMPMMVSLIGVCGVRLLWIATVFTQSMYHSPTTVYISYPISWIIAFAALLVCYFVAKALVKKKQTAAGLPVTEDCR